MRVMLTGGLTGGHVMPTVALGLALRSRGHEVLYVGARGALEAEMCLQYGLPFRGIGHHRHGRVRHALSLVLGSVESLPIVRSFRPSVVFSKGSAIAVPVVTAARLLGVPVVAHESDVVPGSETLRLARYCDMICLGYKSAQRFFTRPTSVTGNMTRPNFTDGDGLEGRRRLGLTKDQPLIFVTGGSQGSVSINELVAPILPRLTERYAVVHQCGVGKRFEVSPLPAYRQLEFLHEELKHVYAASSVVVARAGATSIAEICHYQVPAILIPMPWAESDHQRQNALELARHGVCRILSQETATPADLQEAIEETLAQGAEVQERYLRMANDEPFGLVDASERIIDVLERYGRPR